MVSFSPIFLAALFLASSLFGAAPNAEWHLVKNKNLGTLPAGATLHSIKVSRAPIGEIREEARVEGVIFPASSFQLEVVDSPAREKTAAEVLEEKHFLAGVNGGYFQPDGTPLGFLIARGKLIHPQGKTRLLSGFFVATPHDMSLLRTTEKMPTPISEGLQAGPFLVDQGMPVAGLEATRVARRTFLATDNQGLWVMGIISPVTLAEASQVLLAAAPSFFPKTKLYRALNLDGGSSSALWVNLQPEPFSQQEFGHVRNFLGLRLRE